MKVKEIYQHLKKKGTWVNWKTTCDQILVGKEDMEIMGVAVAWMPTFRNLEKAAEYQCNLFITHEPLFGGLANSFGVYRGGSVGHFGLLQNSDKFEGIMLEEDDIWIKKVEYVVQHKMTVVRCHDVWDDFPEVGIHGAWAKWLGFHNPPLKKIKFYEVHDVSNRTLGDVAKQVLDHVKSLGQECVHVIGDQTKRVSRIALGTGAITNYRMMYHELDADVLLITDDGTRLWESAQWAEDTGVPLIIVNHATAEEPGVRALANYLQEQFPTVPVKAIERGCLYRTIC